MARVTVEDCVEVITNRFELVALAAQRAKQIASGAPLTLDRDNDKDAVVALREIAERTISLETLEQEAIASYSSYKMSESVSKNDEEEDFRQNALANEVSETFDDMRGSYEDQEDELEDHMSFAEMDEDVED